MKKLKQIVKKMSILILIFLLILVLAGVLFVNFSPEFGGSISKEQQLLFEQSQNYKAGKFMNNGDVEMTMDFKKGVKMFKGFFSPQPLSVPKNDVPVEKMDSVEIAHFKDSTRLIWFGHSTFLLQIRNKNILIDPMFGSVPSPHPALGTKRFSKELPIEIEKLPFVDAVLISHDHYDHLDYGSIKKLKDKVGLFYTPLGVGAHLREWGVESDRIVELDWWGEVSFDDLIFRCTPAQHFSGRGLTDRGKTLWSSWIIQSPSENIFFSGDSGYGNHFKAIGEAYGPFDLALIECGQYNELWHEIHMFPEETAQAGLDVRAKTIMPIHWGAFKLAMHAWNEPVQRFTKSAEALGLEVITPKIGAAIDIQTINQKHSIWWE